jgi:hypothetical protein
MRQYELEKLPYFLGILFERVLLHQAKYPSGEIHGDWNDAIKKEFRAWFAKYPKKTTVTPEALDAYLAR